MIRTLFSGVAILVSTIIASARSRADGPMTPPQCGTVALDTLVRL